MTISVWRYSHLVLAVSSFLLLTLASVTGVILSFEPVIEKTQAFRVANFKNISLAEVIPVLQKTYPEISELTVDANQFVKIKGVDHDGDNMEVYIDPRNGKILGIPPEKSEFFLWVNNLHRSLFLKETGRFLMGFTSFLLFLITVSGTILIIKRQQSVKHFFKKIIKDNFAQYYHVFLGRLMLIPILIISLTGTYLSMERFGIIDKQKASVDVDFDKIRTSPQKNLIDFDVFKNNRLADIKTIEFPFSDDAEDYFTLKFNERELAVNQITGDILDEVIYPKAVYFTELSLDLHTGRANFLWALLLAVASANILFFIYSGFLITWKRISKRTKNKYTGQESQIIILVGSENGSTLRYAQLVQEQLIKSGEKAHLTELNKYDIFPNATHFIIFAATYGLGDATTNAANFIKLLEKHPQNQTVNYSVLGFGSKSYRDFCKFAFDVNQKLAQQSWAKPVTDVLTVNDKSPADILLWIETWEQQSGITLNISPDLLKVKQQDLKWVTVLNKNLYNSLGIFTLRFKPKGKLTVKSGDLLAVYPANDHRERLYSIGIVDKEINLSVRLHPHGLGSQYLHNLELNEKIKVKLISNPHFHFPRKASSVIMISNGTGIAPFIGMINQNKSKTRTYLYCGFRNNEYLKPYKNILEESKELNHLSNFKVAYSRENKGHYVNELIVKDADLIANTLRNNGVIMICGSLSMERDVMEKMEGICQQNFGKSISFYQSRGQVLTGCY